MSKATIIRTTPEWILWQSQDAEGWQVFAARINQQGGPPEEPSHFPHLTRKAAIEGALWAQNQLDDLA